MNESSFDPKGLRDFALIIFGTMVLRWLIPVVPIPLGVLPFANVILTILFLAFPVIAIYRAMSGGIDTKKALLMLILGIAIQGIAIFLDLKVFKRGSFGSAFVEPFKPTGLQIWCIGLGALVASLVREKNILIPICIFLIAYDIFLVLTPLGFTQKFMQAAPAVLQQGGLSLPKASTVMPTTGKAEYSGYIGPADLVFMGTFFLAMFRFNMRPLQTLRVMIPVLLGYLVFVLTTGYALPALVPIGIVSLAVNWKEFKLSKDEWASTAVLTVLMVGVVVYSATRPRKPVAPSRKPAVAVNPAQEEMPAKANPNPPRSSVPSAQQSTPSPQ